LNVLVRYVSALKVDSIQPDMNKLTNRRRFLTRAGSLALGSFLTSRPAQAIEPFNRKGKPHFALGLVAYSFRDYLNSKDTSKRITLLDFIDFCADHGCDGAEITTYYFPPQFDNEYLLKLKRHAFLRGVEICGTAVGNNFVLPKGEKRDSEIALVKRWIDNSALMGAPHIRIFAGSKPRDMSVAEAKKLCMDAFEECTAYAGTKGVFLGLENHSGIATDADQLIEMVRAVNSPWFGISLDSGNFQADDPYAAFEQCAPYAVNVQVKVELQRRGKPKEPADFARLVGILRKANYQGYVSLEYEAEEDPYQAIPKWLNTVRSELRARS
jgi:sugar phosphate isomerase/epimerase